MELAQAIRKTIELTLNSWFEKMEHNKHIILHHFRNQLK